MQWEEIIDQGLPRGIPPCQAGCPLHLDTRSYIGLGYQARFDDAFRMVKEMAVFPGILGRICEYPCEEECRRKDKDEAVAICSLKRFLADYGRAQDVEVKIEVPEDRKEGVAIVGGGPAGLMAAYDLRRMGYRVSIFEALPFLGGMLRIGVPEFKLPRNVLDEEIGFIEELGVETRLNTLVGKEITLGSLRSDFDAVFIATGTHLSRKLSTEGIEKDGVVWAMDFLKKVNLREEVKLGEQVLVIGGGDVAIDVARTALRSGAKGVQIACLESREEMPASEELIQEAIDEGAIINNSWGPRRILGENNKVAGIELVRCTSVFDDEGRFSPSFNESITNFVKTDMVIVAIGEESDLSFQGKEKPLELTSQRLVGVNPVTLETNMPGIFAGGDVVTGPKSVVEALAAGRKAAISINRHFRGQDLMEGRESESIRKDRSGRLIVDLDKFPDKERTAMRALALGQRKTFEEVNLGFTEEQAVAEADRCFQC